MEVSGWRYWKLPGGGGGAVMKLVVVVAIVVVVVTHGGGASWVVDGAEVVVRNLFLFPLLK